MAKVNVQNIIDNGKMNKFYINVFVTIMLVVVFDGFDQAVYGVTLPSLMKEMNLGATASGLLASAGLWGAVAGALIFSILSDKFGRRALMVTCVVLYSLFTGLCATITSVYVFAAWRFFAGMGIAAVTPIGTAVLSEYSPKIWRRFITINGTLAMPVGLFAAPLLGIVVIPAFGWRSMYLIGLLGLLLIPLVLKLPETMVLLIKKAEKSKIASILTKVDPQFSPNPDDEYEVHTSENVKLSIKSLFAGGLALNTILIWVMFFVNMFVGYAFQIWLPKLITMMGYSLSNALILTTITYVGMFVGTAIASAVANKIGYKKTFIGCYVLTAIFMYSFTIKSNFTVFAILLFLYGTVNVMQCIIYAYTASNYPLSVRTTAMGAGATVTRLGSAISPILLGILIGGGMQPTGIFKMLVVPLAIGAIAVSLTRKAKSLIISSRG
jgi:AAHS family benzoate transporter-like MFS transporter